MSDTPRSTHATNHDVGSVTPVSGQSAEDQAHAKSLDDPLPIFERILPFFVLFFLIAFVVSSWFTSLPRLDSTVANPVAANSTAANPVATDSTAANPVAAKPTAAEASWWDQSPTLFLALLTASFGIWFILAFTSSPWPIQKRKQCFRFAYSFTITTFIILMFPFLGIWKPDISGPIGLIRGCVNNSKQQSNEQIAPASISCAYLGQGGDQTSGASTSSDELKEKSGSLERKAQPAEMPASSDKPGNKSAVLAGANSADKSGTKASVTYAYPWLLTIGGFVGTTICEKDNSPYDCEKGRPTDQNRHSEITNGLVVPFYVVFLAFIGGAVSLTRRIPEYQKRAEPDYKPASDLAALSKFEPYEARESVVFQIMQLISAPFIAITAYWALAPSTVPASIGLAFVSGFASETILMLIRGVVDGIRPQTTMFAGQKKPDVKADTTTGGTQESSDQAKPSVTVRLAVQSDLPLDAGSMALTVDASPVPLSAEGFVELPLEINRAYVLVAIGRSNGEALRAEMTITPSAEDEDKPFSLNLSRRQP